MAKFNLKDSGDRTEFETGAKRDLGSGKGRFDLISPIFLQRLADLYESGAIKYGDRNWEKGIPLNKYLDSAMRHINDYRLGKRDEDHLVQAAWNLIGAVHTLDLIEDGKLPKSLYNIPVYKNFEDISTERLKLGEFPSMPEGVTKKIKYTNLKVAFDLDDVILNTAQEILNNLNYRDFKVPPFEKINDFELLNIINCTRIHLDEAISNSLWSILPLINSFTPAIFGELISRNVNIFIVSHRKEEYRNHIIKNLELCGISPEDYTLELIPQCVSQTSIPDKAAFCIDNDIDFIIDDRLDTLRDIKRRTTTKPILFDRPWNIKDSGITRIHYLTEIFKLL
jgi:5'(3')-deoxyribonucleotidase